MDGLWAGGSGLTGDLSTVVYRLQLLGFNAVRLPFSMKELFEASPKPVGRRGGCSATSPRAVAAATAPPGTPASVLARAPPPGRGFAPSPPGTCSAYVPAHGSVLDRFAWLCDFFVRNGFVVVADYQLNTDASALEDAGKWVGRWAALARKLVAAYPATAGRVVLDIMNEPDCVGMGWQARDGKPAAGDLYLAALDAVFGVWDGFVALVEGCGQPGLARNWGDGFATDPSVLASRRLSDPRPFLDALVGRRYVGQVALAPHVYPPSISQATDEASGPGLWWRLSTSFGYLNKAGYKGHRFPIILGETGSAFADDRDLAPQLDLMKWAMLRGGGSDRRHNRVAGVFLWSWNGNAGSGHGLVDGGSWAALDHTKVAFAASYGAVPWYARAAPGLLRRVATRHTWQDEEEGEGGAQTCPVCPACGGSGNATAAAGDDDADSAAAAAAAAALVVAAPPPRPGTLTTPAGQPFTMRGVAWAGFDAPARPTLAGLGRESFGDALDRLRALGFNTVKLPLSLGAVLKEEKGAGEAAAVSPCAPDAAPGVLAAATLPPGAAASASVAEWVSFPSSPSPTPAAAAATAALCGGGGGGGGGGGPASSSSSSSTPPGLARLAAVAAALAQAGLAVVLEDADGGTAARTDPAAWVGAWSAVAGAVGAAMAGATARDNATSLLGVRLLADPASLGLAWGGGAEGDAEPAVPLVSLYLAAADGVAAAAPGAWVMLAGAGAGEAAFPAGEPAVTSLLTELGARPYARRVVVAPSLDGGDGGAAPAAAAAALAALAARLAGRFPLVLGSLGADLGDPAAAAGLAGAVAALAPGCGLPACQGGGGGGPGGGGARPAPLGGWVWGAWEGSGPGKATPVLAPPGATGATAPPPAAQPLAEGRPAPPPPPVPLPPIAWPTVALLAEGLGLAPWFLPPTAHRRAVGWAGALPAGVAAVEAVAPPAPAPASSASGGGDNPSSLYSAASGDGHAPPPPPPPPPTCRAVVRVVAAGPAAASPAPAPAGLLLVRLANLAPAGPALAPPYRVAVAGPYSALLAGGGGGLVGGGVVEEEEGGGEGPGGPPRPAITGLVTADTATLWPGGSNEVVLALVVLGRADGGGSGATPGLPPAQALAPTGVAVNGAPCALEEVAVAEGGDGSGGPLVVVSAPRRSVA